MGIIVCNTTLLFLCSPAFSCATIEAGSSYVENTVGYVASCRLSHARLSDRPLDLPSTARLLRSSSGGSISQIVLFADDNDDGSGYSGEKRRR